MNKIDLKKKVHSSLSEFFQLEASSSILLALSLIIALILANWNLTQSYYFSTLEIKFGMSLHHWINDGLMAIFFYMVGMEIKKELVSGSLSTSKKAMLPLFGAVGGMIIPSLIFSMINTDPMTSKAWGIPMATDIAFAVGALVAFGKRIPLQLRALLLALAVIDDLGAILVIAFFYSSGVGPIWLLGFLSIAVLNWLLYKKGKWNWSIHICLGLVAWYFMLSSGIHATLAGVIWGLLTPDDKSESAPLDIGIHKLHPYISFLILPVFALANSGLKIPSLNEVPVFFSHSFLWAITIGLTLGKPIGIATAAWICVRSGLGELPDKVNFKHIWGIGFLAGIGFTMALFIAQLAISNEELLNTAKLGILTGSILSGIFGVITLWMTMKKDTTQIQN